AHRPDDRAVRSSVVGRPGEPEAPGPRASGTAAADQVAVGGPGLLRDLDGSPVRALARRPPRAGEEAQHSLPGAVDQRRWPARSSAGATSRTATTSSTGTPIATGRTQSAVFWGSASGT